MEAGGVQTTSIKEEHRMNLHANAKTCPNSRELLARRVTERGWSCSPAAEASG